MRELALNLFDRTQTLHELGEDARRLLDEAARLSDTPIPHAKKKPFKASLAFVNAQADPDLSEDGRVALAAALAVYHGLLKRKQLADLDLSPEQAGQALASAALLRLAAGLNSRGPAATRYKLRQTDDELWLILDGPQAKEAVAAVRREAALWNKLGYPRIVALEAARAAIRLAPLPEPTEKIGMGKDDPLSEAGRKALRFQFARMLALEADARLGEDIEGVHRMRVATRRLRAAFEVFGPAFERSALQPYLRRLRQLGRDLGKVRDLDVLIEHARQYCETLPPERCGGLDPLLHAWEAQRAQARSELLDYLNGKDYADFKRKFNIFLNTPGAGARPVPPQPTPQRVRDLAPLLIYRRLAAVRAYAPLIEHAPVATLHMLRIEFKKLRYTVEYFQEVLGRRSVDVIATVKQLQDHLGAMNDAEVAAGLVEQFVHETEHKQAGLPFDQRVDLQETLAYLARRLDEREQLVRAFPEAWQTLFLRPAFRRSLAQSVSVL